MANGKVDGKIVGFPGAAQVPTVGQRMCPFLSQAVIQNGHPGTITVQCVGAGCRLWEWCSGRVIAEACEKIIQALEK